LKSGSGIGASPGYGGMISFARSRPSFAAKRMRPSSVRQFAERSQAITSSHATVSAGFQRSGFMRYTWNSTGSTGSASRKAFTPAA
jgi:hypothetical protein